MRAVPITLLLTACASPAAMPDAAPGDSNTIAGSRCAPLYDTLVCTHGKTTVRERVVAHQVPIGDPPLTGWPAVIFYQGSYVPGVRAFVGPYADQLGAYELTATVQALLDGGYAVIAPNAVNDGAGYWQTNIPPHATSWPGCDDDLFVKDLLAGVEGGTFGPIDMTRLHAMGISSGGFMTSRMAVSYPGVFRSLAIVAASYATCSTTCSVPSLPADHPPTLFVHGDNDTLVPPSTMYPYRDQLVSAGRMTNAIISTNHGHEWLPEGKTAIPEWFATH